jgi:hypothetical protein
MIDEPRTAQVLTPQELRRRTQDRAVAKAQEAMDAIRKEEEHRRELQEMFMSRKVHPEGMNRLMTAISRAADAGENELLVFRFPSTYLPDGGRAINNFEPNWPDSLVGFAKDAHAFYEEHLRDAGYRLRAQIIDFPEGMPGDVGLFLVW